MVRSLRFCSLAHPCETSIRLGLGIPAVFLQHCTQPQFAITSHPHVRMCPDTQYSIMHDSWAFPRPG